MKENIYKFILELLNWWTIEHKEYKSAGTRTGETIRWTGWHFTWREVWKARKGAVEL